MRIWVEELSNEAVQADPAGPVKSVDSLSMAARLSASLPTWQADGLAGLITAFLANGKAVRVEVFEMEAGERF